MAAPAASAPAAAAPAAAASAPATPTFKVFVGNLSFKTREGELQKAFSGAGHVLSANIITRGPRSLGYGFVEFATEAEANKSVTLMNKRELDGREINVEVAKNREDAPPRAAGDGAPRGAGRGRGGAGAGAGAGGASRGGVLRRRGGAGGAPGAGGAVPAAAGGEGAANGGAPRGRGGYRGGRGGRGGAAAAGGAPAAAGGSPAAAGGAPRPPRPEASAAPRTQSATTLFVANLPFGVDNKQLQEIFQGCNPTNAHVVTKRNGRSKGFGFVEFKNAEDQAKALAAVDKKAVQGRELIVKVALTDQVHHEGKSDSPAAGSPATAPAAAAPTK